MHIKCRAVVWSMAEEKRVDYSYSMGYQPITNASLAPNMGYSTLPLKSRNVLARVISDRVSFLRGSAAEINALMKERLQLKEALECGIDEEMCRIQTNIYELDLMPDMVKRSSLEKQIMELRKEKRSQQLSRWQDTVRLKGELRKVEKELRSAMLDLWMIRFLS